MRVWLSRTRWRPSCAASDSAGRPLRSAFWACNQTRVLRCIRHCSRTGRCSSSTALTSPSTHTRPLTQTRRDGCGGTDWHVCRQGALPLSSGCRCRCALARCELQLAAAPGVAARRAWRRRPRGHQHAGFSSGQQADSSHGEGCGRPASCVPAVWCGRAAASQPAAPTALARSSSHARQAKATSGHGSSCQTRAQHASQPRSVAQHRRRHRPSRTV